MSKNIIDIYSKIEKDKLLHRIVRKDLFTEINRKDLVADSEFLQIAAMSFPNKKTFRPHKHLYKDFNDKTIAQESWIVIQGKVRVILYDLDDNIIHEDVLNAGDFSVTLYGGHNYEILEENTFVYEYKTGPYYGVKIDKEFIND